MSTLAERLKQLSEGLPRGWQKKLALACHVSAPSVSDWISGKSKNIQYDHAVKAAMFFGVNADWLRTGKGNAADPISTRSDSVAPENTIQASPLQLDNSYAQVVNAINVLRDNLIAVDSLTRAQAKPIIDKVFSDPEGSHGLGERMAQTLCANNHVNPNKKVA